MINTHGKLLFAAFFVILLGVVLIQPIATEVEKVKTASYGVSNETLAFTTLTTIVINESVIMTNTTGSGSNLTGTLTNDILTVLTAIRNISSQSVIGHCNVTLSSAAIVCNHTGYPAQLFFDYTWTSGRTDTLANDEVTSVTGIRNITSESIIGGCNVTLSSGTLLCNNTNSATGYADYSYTPDTYVRSRAARSLLTLTILFFAILVLTIGIGYAWRSFKEGGVI